MARKVNGTKSAEWRANVGSMARPFKNGDVDSGPRLPKRGRVDVGRRNACKVFRNARGVVTRRCNLSRLTFPICDCRLPIDPEAHVAFQIGNWQSAIDNIQASNAKSRAVSFSN